MVREQQIIALEEAFAEFMTHLDKEREKGNCIIRGGDKWEIFYKGEFVDMAKDRLSAYEKLFSIIRRGDYDKYLEETQMPF